MTRQVMIFVPILVIFLAYVDYRASIGNFR